MYTNYNNIYGWDKLSKALLIMALILAYFKIGRIIGIICLVYAFWRSRSKDIINSNKECMEFEKVIYNIKRMFIGESGNIYSIKEIINNIKNKINYRRDFTITRCANCSQKMRLPKKKGNILVTCPRCLFKFKLRT